MTDVDPREVLATVDDPQLDTDILSQGLVTDVGVEDDVVSVSMDLGAPHAPVADEIRRRVEAAFETRGVEAVVSTDADTADRDDISPLSDVKNVIAVASGKGGVGKSTVAVNLAASMAQRGARVGILDADVYGPNIPRMLDARERPDVTEDKRLLPVERHGLSVMSMEFITEGDGPVIWRGPMVDKVITQLLDDVAWGALDYLVVDLPPGTGDTQLTLLQRVPLTGAVVVTTPQAVAVDDADRGMQMFSEYDTPVLGVVENMSGFVCPDCGAEHDVFNSGGGQALADSFDLPFLGSIPLDPEVRTRGDNGRPVAFDETTEAGRAFHALTTAVMDNTSLVHRRTRPAESGSHD